MPNLPRRKVINIFSVQRRLGDRQSVRPAHVTVTSFMSGKTTGKSVVERLCWLYWISVIKNCQNVRRETSKQFKRTYRILYEKSVRLSTVERLQSCPVVAVIELYRQTSKKLCIFARCNNS